MTQQVSICKTGQKMGFDAAVVRGYFPILDQQVNGKPLVYLDSAASAQKPQMVLDTMSSAYSQTYANVHRGLHYLSEASTDAYEAVRGKVAQLIGARSEKEIVFTSGATMALNLIAHCYGNTNLGEGDEVLISVVIIMPTLSLGIFWVVGLGQRRLPLLLMQMVASIWNNLRRI